MAEVSAMQHQTERLAATAWDVLVIFDACRADVLRDVVTAEAVARGEVARIVDAVKTPGRNTPAWLARTWQTIGKRKPLYITANPMVSQEVRRREYGIDLLNVWDKHWGRWTRLALPCVHPASLNSVVIELLGQGQGSVTGRALVAHYMQPHAPYIGALPLNCACGSRATLAYDGARLPRVIDEIVAGRLKWPKLRAAYRSNVELVWRTFLNLLPHLSGKVIVTSDHGELLGENKLYGHRQLRRYKHAATLSVPWIELDAVRDDRRSGEEQMMLEKLRILGYG